MKRRRPGLGSPSGATWLLSYFLPPLPVLFFFLVIQGIHNVNEKEEEGKERKEGDPAATRHLFH